MSISELYWFIFFDEFISSLLLPLNERYVLSTTLILNEEINILYSYFSAFLGAIAGAIMNFLLATIILNGFNLKLKVDRKIKIIVICSLILLPLNYFGPVFSSFAATIRLKFRLYLLVICIIYLAYFLTLFLV
ncbi:MAG: hypothetical protein HON42_04860 [Alphaproteobacteria bacterium]|jgi:membrane protein YqaA with SNARE-associated domain|nr:hypothetical protein [Alphaproteobacteria bacterium]